MIPIVTLVAFTLMGIEGIADEIEQPFGTDSSDLPLGAASAALCAKTR
jgi:ion channel-forming bestrophin family protein